MKLARISSKDKEVFDRFLSLREHELAVYSFADIIVWKALFDIEWAVIDDALCVYFRDAFGTFLYLPPLAAGELTLKTLERAYAVMHAANANREVSRIENVEEPDRTFFLENGFSCKLKSCDYICLRSDMEELKGNKYKSKRASCNYAQTHYRCDFRPYARADRVACLRVYDEWMHERMCKRDDALYQGMLGDSRQCLKLVLDEGEAFGLQGRVAAADGKLRGFTFGYELNPWTWCILYEVAELSVKGLAQFMFREFCREMKTYRFINVMDDSGLENLRRVKLSYHPVRLASSYTARRKG